MDLERLRRGANVDGDCGSLADRLPVWMDRERFRRGQEVFQRHAAAICLALLCSLTMGFSISSLLESLVFNRASDTAVTAMQRYAETFVHVVLWHVTDVWDFETPSLGHRSLAFVRRVHARVARAMTRARDKNQAKNLETTADTDSADRKYISQYDMAVVQAGFFAATIMYPTGSGASCISQSELEDYVFFWRGIGYLLGIDDEYNVCSHGYDSAYSLCKSIERDVVWKGLENPPKNFDRMADAFLNGLNLRLRGFPLHTKESVIAFSFGIAGRQPPTWVKLTWGDYVRLAWMRLNVYLSYLFPVYEELLNKFTMFTFKKAFPLVEKQLNTYTDRVSEDFAS